MKPGLWNSVEALSTQSALRLEWQAELGPDHDRASGFLSTTLEQAESYPCTREPRCGCRHRIVINSDEDIVGLCDCDASACEPIRLSVDDLVFYQLDMARLGDSICAALSLARHEGP